MSFDEENLGPAERELEGALAGLAPASPTFTLQQAQIRALVAHERRRTRAWQAVAAVLAVAAGISFYARVTPRPEAAVVERVVWRDRAPSATPSSVQAVPPAVERSASPPASFAYLELREKVLSRGVESLRAPGAASGPAMPVESALPTGRAKTPHVAPLVEYLFSGGQL